MAFTERKDIGVRLGIEKALYPDEALSRSQIQPGRNISFEYKTNRDILIHALASKAAGGSADLKLFHVKILLQYYFESSGSIKHIACTYNGADNLPVNTILQDDDETIIAGNASGEDRTNYAKYGTMHYIDLYHNFDLANSNKFIYSIIDTSAVSNVGPFSVLNIPKIVGLTGNTARLWGRTPGNNSTNNWLGSENTMFAADILSNDFKNHYSGTIKHREYAITMLSGE